MMRLVCTVLFTLILLSTPLFGQGRPYEGPEDPAGDIAAIRIGYLNGNRIFLAFENNTAFAVGGKPISSKWPNNYEGTVMLDRVSLLIGAEVFVRQDSIPVTDLAEVARLRAEIDTLFFIQSNDPGRNDQNYDATIDWALYPVPGYFNETQDFVAMSNFPTSWPPQGWPAPNFATKWPGEWNGRFGRGIRYADLETYFVANDAQDLENIVRRNDPDQKLITTGPRYYPRPGHRIGDINPDVTVQRGMPWGGLGLRVSLRGFQWNNPEARDIIFLEYEISNISAYDLPSCGFGFFLDTAIGGEHSPDGDVGYYNTKLDLAYCWDYDGVGAGGLSPGILGMAYLESPGKPFDSRDNDEDGLIDEKRDNPAGEKVGPYDGIANLASFLEFYNLQESDLKEHFQGDEDGDWVDGVDLNGNGAYAYQDALGDWYLEPGENPGNDVGLDGVGPMDINYHGPDEGEGNHRPDFVEGVGCEPNFAATDVSESDMVGLTSFHLFDYYQWTGNNWLVKDDKNVWDLMNDPDFRAYIGEPNSIYFQFSTSKFPFYKGRTERISIAMLHTYENLAGLQSTAHSAPTLFRAKETAQIIYEKDYRFAQPPLLPSLKATAGDGKVILTWDDRADRLTREPFLENINDFEGYKLYRATDKLMSDPEVVTDGQGTRMFRKPIYQCDLLDNISGYADFGLVGGTSFYLGDETGLTHYFVDENVLNGRTYYYALVAYDFGAREVGGGISPTENNIVIELDEAEEIIRMGNNIAVVTPHQNAAGYDDPTVAGEAAETFGSGLVEPLIVDRAAIKPGHTYKLFFRTDTVGYARRNSGMRSSHDLIRCNSGLQVYDVSDGNRLVYKESPARFPAANIQPEGKVLTLDGTVEETFPCYEHTRELFTDVFDGLQLKLSNLTVTGEYDAAASGWVTGSAPIAISPSTFESAGFPYTYDIVFTDDDSAYVCDINRFNYVYNLEGNTGSSSAPFKYLTKFALPFYVVNRDVRDKNGEPERLGLLVEDLNRNGAFDIFEDRFLAGHRTERPTIMGTLNVYWAGTVFGFDFHQVMSEEELPNPDDIYRVKFRRPFSTADSVLFTVAGETAVTAAALDEDMARIRVVPNPYVVTNTMEPAVANKYLNQRRRIMFTHLPARCTIRIFTSSGILVDTIEVENPPSDGTVHWDLLTREGLEIAAGMYVYHVKAEVTGKEKIGKFAVIK